MAEVRLGLSLGYWGAGPTDMMPLVLEAERLGFDSVWSAEAYASDAVTLISWGRRAYLADRRRHGRHADP